MLSDRVMLLVCMGSFGGSPVDGYGHDTDIVCCNYVILSVFMFLKWRSKYLTALDSWEDEVH